MYIERLRLLLCISALLQLIFAGGCVGFEPISTATAAGFALVSSVFIGGYSYFKCRMNECCTDLWINRNVTELAGNLKSRLYGQHLVIDIVSRHVKAHLRNEKPKKALALSFHGWTGTGKNYVSQIITDTIYREGINSQYVHLISATRDFPHLPMVELYKDVLSDWISGNVSECQRSIFIFDEMDKMPVNLIDIIKPFLDYYEQIRGIDYRKVIFIFLSNTAGHDINSFVLDHWRKGEQRESIKLSDMEALLSRTAVNVKGGLWHSELITKSLITAFIPFLPLEKMHVKACIRDSLVAGKHFKSVKDISENVVNEVANELSYFPDDEKIFSSSGCKRVAEKVDYVMEPI